MTVTTAPDPSTGLVAPAPRVLERLKKRADFLRAAKAVRVHKDAFTLQARRRGADEKCGAAPRVGFTVTKKIGNAVVRNRIRRRLRAVCDRFRDEFTLATDYVVVAKAEALAAPFERLGTELSAALAAAAGKLDRPRRPDRPATDRPPTDRPAAEKRA